jgi:signal peptide peptidase SppA
MVYEFAQLLGRSQWLMEPSAMRRLVTEAASLTSAEVQARLAAVPSRLATAPLVGDVAVIDVSGPITYRESYFSLYFGGTPIERMQVQFRAALNDPAVRAIVFRVDSPGGTVDMVPEFAAEIFRARGIKPMLAVSDTQMCSAAYWLASQADQVLVSPSAETGSIGVYLLHQDVSKLLDDLGVKMTFIFAGEHKVDGNPFEPLGDDVKARWQADVSATHADFLAAVARGRGVTAADVRGSYGQGLVYGSKDAVRLGVADKIATFEDALLRAAKARPGGARAGAVDPEAVAAVVEPAAAPLAADRDYVDLAIRIAERR